MRRKGIGFRDLANRLRWLCKKEEPITENEDWDEYDDYDYDYDYDYDDEEDD